MRGAIFVGLFALLLVGAFIVGCSSTAPPATGANNQSNVTGDAGTTLENGFDNSLPQSTMQTSATSDLSSLDSDLNLQ